MVNRAILRNASLWAAMFLAGSAWAEEKSLFDFEDQQSVGAWSNIDIHAERAAEAKAAYDLVAGAATNPATVPAYKAPATRPAEPAVKIASTTEGATSGQHAMKITCGGGRMPTVTVTPPVDDWRPYKSFRADVTVSRTCMVVFRAMAATSKYGIGYNEGVSRWEFAARCEPGKNLLAAPAPQYANTLWNHVTAFQIYVFEPQDGQSILVDNIRLSTERATASVPFNEKPAMPKFTVAGTDLVVASVDALADQLKDKWVKPQDQTVEQIEAAIRAEYEKLKADHPKAVLAVLRDGQRGYDPANPDKPFAGWADAGTPSHLPMALTLASFSNAGKSADIETCFRNRPGFLRVDLSSIPKGSEILFARLIVHRGLQIARGWETSPTMFVAEPLARPWHEYDVTVFEPAKGELWKDYAGQTWGEGGDSAAIFLAHGPSSGKAMNWDFTHAVKYWTDGQHANNGFILHGAPKYVDYLHICTREHATQANRPAVAVIYEPRP